MNNLRSCYEKLYNEITAGFDGFKESVSKDQTNLCQFEHKFPFFLWAQEKLNGANILKRLILKQAYSDSGLKEQQGLEFCDIPHDSLLMSAI